MKKKRKKKNEKWEESNSNNNCFYFYFFLLKNLHFVYFVSKYIWNAVIKHETQADAVIQPRILSKNLGRQKEEDKKVVLGNRLGIWADFQSNGLLFFMIMIIILFYISYIHILESTFHLEKNKSIC